MNVLNLILQKRVYWLSLFALIGILFVLLVWMFGFQEVYKKHMSLASSFAAIRQQAGSDVSTASVNSSLQAAITGVSEVKEKLQQQSEIRHSTEMIPYIVKVLDRISAKYGVQLQGVRPQEPEVVLMFEERLFDITISGLYRDLFKWVKEAESDLHPMTIKSFQLNPNGRGNGVKMAVRVVSYSVTGDLQ